MVQKLSPKSKRYKICTMLSFSEKKWYKFCTFSYTHSTEGLYIYSIIDISPPAILLLFSDFAHAKDKGIRFAHKGQRSKTRPKEKEKRKDKESAREKKRQEQKGKDKRDTDAKEKIRYTLLSPLSILLTLLFVIFLFRIFSSCYCFSFDSVYL